MGVRWLKGGRGDSAGGQLEPQAGDVHEGLKKTPRAGQPEVLHEQKRSYFSPDVNRACLREHSGTTKGSHAAPWSPSN